MCTDQSAFSLRPPFATHYTLPDTHAPSSSSDARGSSRSSFAEPAYPQASRSVSNSGDQPRSHAGYLPARSSPTAMDSAHAEAASPLHEHIPPGGSMQPAHQRDGVVVGPLPGSLYWDQGEDVQPHKCSSPMLHRASIAEIPGPFSPPLQAHADPQAWHRGTRRSQSGTRASGSLRDGLADDDCSYGREPAGASGQLDNYLQDSTSIAGRRTSANGVGTHASQGTASMQAGQSHHDQPDPRFRWREGHDISDSQYNSSPGTGTSAALRDDMHQAGLSYSGSQHTCKPTGSISSNISGMPPDQALRESLGLSIPREPSSTHPGPTGTAWRGSKKTQQHMHDDADGTSMEQGGQPVAATADWRIQAHALSWAPKATNAALHGRPYATDQSAQVRKSLQKKVMVQKSCI